MVCLCLIDLISIAPYEKIKVMCFIILPDFRGKINGDVLKKKSILTSVIIWLLGMVEATIEDLAFTILSLRATIWGYPYIVGEAVLSTTLLEGKRSRQAQEQKLEF